MKLGILFSLLVVAGYVFGGLSTIATAAPGGPMEIPNTESSIQIMHFYSLTKPNRDWGNTAEGRISERLLGYPTRVVIEPDSVAIYTIGRIAKYKDTYTELELISVGPAEERECLIPKTWLKVLPLTEEVFIKRILDRSLAFRCLYFGTQHEEKHPFMVSANLPVPADLKMKLSDRASSINVNDIRLSIYPHKNIPDKMRSIFSIGADAYNDDNSVVSTSCSIADSEMVSSLWKMLDNNIDTKTFSIKCGSEKTFDQLYPSGKRYLSFMGIAIEIKPSGRGGAPPYVKKRRP